MKKKIKLIKSIIIISILIISILLYKYIDINSLQNYISNNPIIYILSFIILPIFFFPVPILAIVAGILFGVFYGSLYTIIGAVINSILMYYISKFLSNDFRNFLINKLSKKNIAINTINGTSKNLFIIFFLLRLVPLISYTFINYLSGMTKISLEAYILSTLLGIIPGTIILINIGDKIYNVNSFEFIISIIFIILLIILSLIFMKICKRKLNGNNNNSNIQ